jgi:CBS domain-containing protein
MQGRTLIPPSVAADDRTVNAQTGAPAMFVSEIMTPHAECTSPGATLQGAAQRMKMLNVGSLPVCHEDRLIGIITDRDIAIRAVADGMDPATTHVEAVMTRGVTCCFDDQDIREAADMMEEKQIRRLVVLNHDNRLVGIVSLGDLAVRGRDEELSAEALEQISEETAPLGVGAQTEAQSGKEGQSKRR